LRERLEIQDSSPDVGPGIAHRRCRAGGSQDRLVPIGGRRGLPVHSGERGSGPRQHVVDEIIAGRLVEPGFVGFETVQLSPLDADLSVGGKVHSE
jgi:hypothetical protein